MTGKRNIRLLIADDEKNLREVLREELAGDGFEVLEAENGLAALDLLGRNEFDVLILDLNMPGIGGIELLERMRAMELPTEVIVLTANATIATAVEAMKLGAYEYLTKPFDLEALTGTIERAHEKRVLRSENLRLRQHLKRQSSSVRVIARSAAMRRVLETADKVARTKVTVLVTGETGTGKELVARTIHCGSGREGAFVSINCAAIPEQLMESELFGYEKGAFTGAHEGKLGLLEVAHNGTLFLDEIGDMAPQLQVKLLRVLETGRFFRIGGVREQQVDIRVLSATNRDLKTAARRSAFRQDLYYRLSGFIVHVPPLRERQEDIAELIDFYRQKASHPEVKRFTKDALALLLAYSWPGNVRELQNVVQRALLLSRNGTITPADLPGDLLHDEIPGGRRLADVEKKHILSVLREAGGMKERAAEILGIHPRTLRRKLAGYGTRE